MTLADDQIDGAILSALDAAGDMVPWRSIRSQIRGVPYWRKVAALNRLFAAGQVYVVKISGSNYVELEESPPMLAAPRVLAVL